MAEQIPEAWVGEQIKLRYWHGDGRNTTAGKLAAVNDRGVVTIETEEDSRTRFYPWGAVLHIEPGEDENPSGQAEIHGF